MNKVNTYVTQYITLHSKDRPLTTDLYVTTDLCQLYAGNCTILQEEETRNYNLRDTRMQE